MNASGSQSRYSLYASCLSSGNSKRSFIELSRIISYRFSFSLKKTPHVVKAVKSALLFFSAAASSVIIMYSQLGGDSSAHSFHHSRLTIAASSAVGFCWYCAFHWNNGIEALVWLRARRLKNSGQRGFSVSLVGSSGSATSKIAGNSTISYWSAWSFCAISRTTRPVKSSRCHLVCIIATRPPGIRRVRAP